MNAMMVLKLYKWYDSWVFDDDSFGLVKEAFVCGMTEIIDDLVEKYIGENVDDGFYLTFSKEEFPTAQTHIRWERPDVSGNWYRSDEFDKEGWLCPALFHYFEDAPQTIYVHAKKID